MIMAMIEPALAEKIAKANELTAGELVGEILFPKVAETRLVDWKKVYNNPDMLELNESSSLHYLLSGKHPHERNIAFWWICPGQDHHVGTEADAYFLIQGDEIDKFLQAVEALNELTIRSRYNPKEMYEQAITLTDWADDSEKNLESLLKSRDKLLEFLKRVRKENKALVTGFI